MFPFQSNANIDAAIGQKRYLSSDGQRGEDREHLFGKELREVFHLRRREVRWAKQSQPGATKPRGELLQPALVLIADQLMSPPRDRDKLFLASHPGRVTPRAASDGERLQTTDTNHDKLIEIGCRNREKL